MKIITSGVKQRHCGRWFYFDSHGRWNLLSGNLLDINKYRPKLVREMKKIRYVVVKYTR